MLLKKLSQICIHWKGRAVCCIRCQWFLISCCHRISSVWAYGAQTGCKLSNIPCASSGLLRYWSHTHTHRRQARHGLSLCFSVCLRDAELCVSWWKHSQLLTQDLQRGLQQIITGAQTPEPHNTCPNPSASSYLHATFILGAYIILRFSLLYITHTAFTVFIFLLFNLYSILFLDSKIKKYFIINTS